MRSVAMCTEPEFACVSPDAIRSRVLLPHPEGPTIETNSPRLTQRSTCDSAWVPSGKVMPTSWNSMMCRSTAGAPAVSSGARTMDMGLLRSGGGAGRGRGRRQEVVGDVLGRGDPDIGVRGDR